MLRVPSHLRLTDVRMADFLTSSPTNSVKARLGRCFRAHGQFCARHPWEVIVSVVTLTVSVLSIGILSGGKVGTLCGINAPCEEQVRLGRGSTLACLRLYTVSVLW